MLFLRNIFIGTLFFLTQITFTLYLPTLPKLSEIFLINPNQIMFSLTISFIGYAIGHLFWGTASDYFGRKKLILISLSIYTVFQLIILRTSFYPLFLSCFAVTGFAAAAYTSIGNALLRDLFQEKTKHAIALIGIVMAIGPAVGPYIGAHLSDWFSWRAVYLFLLCYAIINLIGLKFLVKTKNSINKPKHDKALTALKTILVNKKYLGDVLPLALMFGVMFGYLGASPFIYMEHFHLTLHQYAYVAFFTTITAVIGSIINSRLIIKHTPQWVSIRGMSLAAISLGFILLFTLLNIDFLALFIILFACLMLGIGMTLPSCKAGAMMVFEKNLGMASSLMKFIQTLGSISLTGLGAQLYSGESIYDVILLLAFACFAALGLAVILRKTRAY